MILSPLHRAAFCKFRYGVAPIRIETRRYEYLSVDERKWPFCNNVEDEGHVLFNCHLYEDIRSELIEKATILEPSQFIRFGKNEVRFYQIYVDKVSCQNLLYNFKKKNALYM